MGDFLKVASERYWRWIWMYIIVIFVFLNKGVILTKLQRLGDFTWCSYDKFRHYFVVKVESHLCQIFYFIMFLGRGRGSRWIKGEISLPIQYILIFNMFNVMKKTKNNIKILVLLIKIIFNIKIKSSRPLRSPPLLQKELSGLIRRVVFL